jgi:hypothetical protein
MPKRSFFILGVVILAMGVSSCFLDPDEDTKDPPPPDEPYGDLSVKEHVLRNIQKSYNDRNIQRYDELLDDNFTFFFATGDVGGSIPDQWGRADELPATDGLFCRTGCNPGLPLCRSIRMDLKYESGVVQWVDVIPEDFPNETWQTTTVFYEFTIEIEPDETFIAVPGARAQFTVRNIGTVDDPLYKLVEFRDLGDE